MGLFDFLKKTETAEIEELVKKLKAQSTSLKDVKAQLRKNASEHMTLQQYLRTSRTNIPKPLQYSSKNIVAG